MSEREPEPVDGVEPPDAEPAHGAAQTSGQPAAAGVADEPTGKGEEEGALAPASEGKPTHKSSILRLRKWVAERTQPSELALQAAFRAGVLLVFVFCATSVFVGWHGVLLTLGLMLVLGFLVILSTAIVGGLSELIVGERFGATAAWVLHSVGAGWFVAETYAPSWIGWALTGIGLGVFGLGRIRLAAKGGREVAELGLGEETVASLLELPKELEPDVERVLDAATREYTSLAEAVSHAEGEPLIEGGAIQSEASRVFRAMVVRSPAVNALMGSSKTSPATERALGSLVTQSESLARANTAVLSTLATGATLGVAGLEAEVDHLVAVQQALEDLESPADLPGKM